MIIRGDDEQVPCG